MEEEFKKKKEELFDRLNQLTVDLDFIKETKTSQDTTEIEMREELIKSFDELNNFLLDFIKNNEEINGEE